MTTAIDFDFGDAIDLAWVGPPRGNDDGSLVGFLRTEQGETDFAVLPAADPTAGSVSIRDGTFDPAVRTDAGTVSEFEWRPAHPSEAALVADGDVEVFDAEAGERRPLVRGPSDCSGVAWSPDGETLAYCRDGTLWLHESEGICAVEFPDDVDVATFLGGPTIRWDPSGRYVAAVIEGDPEAHGIGVYDTEAETTAWSTLPDPSVCMRASFDWVDDGHLVYGEDAMDGASRTYRSVRVDEDEGVGAPIASESVDGLVLPHEPVGSGTGMLAVVSAETGYRHVYVIDVEQRRETVTDADPGLRGDGVIQVTEGEFEARGDASDVPAWNDDGDRLAYVTNRVDAGERHLHVSELDEGTSEEVLALTDVAGNAVWPAWIDDDRIALVRAGVTTPADVHLADASNGGLRRLSASHADPDSLETLPEPQPVEFPASDGTQLYGYLYTPPGATPGDDLPAVVLCHGGPIAQMRRGFHPSKTYSYFHAFDQAFVAEGYAVLELNFRSGIGYGESFEQAIHRKVGVDEVQDCVDAAEFLRSHDLVGDRVGMWGRSYGGFLANALATKTDAYDCAVNVAGIWDWRTWEEWAIEQGPSTWGPGEASWFHNRFGGPPDSDDETVQERYRRASPNTYVDEMETPLLSLHGTEDKNVTVEELHHLIV
ncbi:MAG: prolyl oligopeptidase family serine peptidase, partial [Haloferacaceae archaeon]